MTTRRSSTTISITSDRVRNPVTSELVPVDEAPEGSEDWTAVTVEFEFSGEGYFTPAKTYGEPENCSPEEGGAEITGWTSSVPGVEPTEDEVERAQTALEEELGDCSDDSDNYEEEEGDWGDDDGPVYDDRDDPADFV